MEQCLEDGGGHDGLARASRSGKGEGMLVAVFVPAIAGLPEAVENLVDCLVLIIFQRKLHISPPHRESEIGQIGLVEPDGLHRVRKAARD